MKTCATHASERLGESAGSTPPRGGCRTAALVPHPAASAGDADGLALLARRGLMEMTPGNVVDYDVIRARINELGKVHKIREIAVDPWNATQLATQLTGDGFEVVNFGQGFKDMTAPAKELEKLVVSGKLRHGGHPVLRWMASNVAVEIDAAGNLKPSKKKSTERIDGITATVMALGRALLAPPAPSSPYRKRGIVFI